MDLKEISPFKDFFEPIGELIVAFSILETHVNNTIQILLGISAEDKVLLMQQMTVARRINFFEASLNGKLKDPDALAWTKDIAEDLRRANSHRNALYMAPGMILIQSPQRPRSGSLEEGTAIVFNHTSILCH